MAEAYTPDLIVQLAFGYQPFQTVPTSAWVDVSTYCPAVSPTRGRSSELDTFSASQITIELDSPSRRFDPLNAAGPYYGDLIPNTPLRILARHNSIDYARWYGYVDGFRHKPGTLSVVEVRATDGFKVLAGKRLPQSVYETVVLADSPRAYWKLGEGGDRIVDYSGNKFDGSYEAAETAEAIRPYTTGGAAKANPANQAIGQVRDGRTILDDIDPMTIEFWCQFDGQDPTQLDNYITRAIAGSTSTTSWFVVIAYPTPTVSPVGEIVIRFGDGPNMVNFQYDLFDGLRHHVVIVRAGSSIVCFVDGELVPIYVVTVPGTFAVTFPDTILFGHSWTAELNGTPNVCELRISDVAYYTNTNMLASQVLEHYNAAVAPWDGDNTGTRIGRILDLIGWPASLRDIDAGETLLGPADPAGMTALEYLQLIAQSEQGRLFMSADGKITFHSNERTVTGTSRYTFSDAGTDTGIVDGDLTFSLDDTFLYDEASVQAKYGAPQVAVADGIANPVRTYTLSGLLMRDDRLARQLAERIVYRYGTAKTRVDGWTVQPELDPTSWPTILDLEIGDVVTVELTPDGEGDPITVDLFIEQIADDASGDDYVISFQGSPTDDTVYFEWGGPNGSGWGEGAWR